jgi:hypothetical protein
MLHQYFETPCISLPAMDLYHHVAHIHSELSQNHSEFHRMVASNYIFHNRVILYRISV